MASRIQKNSLKRRKISWCFLILFLILIPEIGNCQDQKKWKSIEFSSWGQKGKVELGNYFVEYYMGGKTGKERKHIWGYALIKDKKGNILKRIEDWIVESIGWDDITGDGTTEIIITTYSGGAHCCETSYIYSLKEKLENILIFNYMGHYNFIKEIKDLNGDGVKEIIVNDGRFDYFDEFSHAGSPMFNQVLCYRDNRYRECIKEFPEFIEKKLQELIFPELEPIENDRLESVIKPQVIEIYAYFILLGREKKGWQKLMAISPDSIKTWLIKYRKEIIEEMKGELPITYE
ncbi:MAG: hypothetical protein ACE5WD_08145 [Candidatus Aminicenantia bacterium]